MIKIAFVYDVTDFGNLIALGFIDWWVFFSAIFATLFMTHDRSAGVSV